MNTVMLAAGAEAGAEVAKSAMDTVIAAMDAVRGPADKLEGLVGKKFWPFPTYSDILFYV